MAQTDREYAEALFMLCAEENTIEQYQKALELVRDVVEQNPDYLELLSSPAIPIGERLSAIDEAFGNDLPEYALSFLKLLCENSRIGSLCACIEEFEKLSRAFENRSVANVTSAVPLSNEQKQKLCAKLEKLTGRTIDAFYTVDEALIGGLKIDIEGKTYDGSIKHRLSDVKDVIIG